MAFAKDKMKPDGSFASGTNNSDELWNYVFDKMYEYLGTGAVEDVEADEDDDDNDLEGEGGDDGTTPGARLASWYFRGFWTLQLWGPLAPLKEKSTFFNVDSLDAPVQGRASVRAEKGKSKRADEDADSSGRNRGRQAPAVLPAHRMK